MKSLKNISVFRLGLILAISLYIDNIYLYILLLAYLIFKNRIEAFIYLALLIFSNLIKIYLFDFIPIGIIEEIKSGYYLVNKGIYKVKLYSDEALKFGDVLFCNKFKPNEYSDIKNNILFYGSEYKKIYTLLIKNRIYNYICDFNIETSSILLKQFYNIYSNDLQFNLGYGITVYYIFKYLSKKSKKLTYLLIFLYSYTFNFQLKFILLVIEMLLESLHFKGKDKYGLELIVLSIININLFNNYSILIPLFIKLFTYIDLNIDFKLYFGLLSSLLFGEVNVLSSYFYKYYLRLRIIFFIFCIILLFIPYLEKEFLFICDLYSRINSISFLNIRGKINLYFLILLIFIYWLFKLENNKVKYIAYILLLLSPLFDPLTSINFIDVGQGDAILIKKGLNRKNVLIDTGSTFNYYKLKRFLLYKGIYNIDYLIITHNDFDHCGNIDNLKKDFNIKEIVYEGKDIELDDILLSYVYLGKYENDNDNSLVYYTNINDISFLLTGDISSSVERKFINEYGPINIDVLKASHHGSYTGNSEYLVANILPKYTIYSTSGMYNHPSIKTINTMDLYGVKQLNTKLQGDISFKFSWFFDYIKTSKGGVIILGDDIRN